MKNRIKLLSVMFVLFGSLTTTALSQKNVGGWDSVCCGEYCGEDFCLGSGSYKCCK